MTNAQKYEEVFGFPPDQDSMAQYYICPTKNCEKCPVNDCDVIYCINEWWDSEYKEPEV